MRPFLNLKGVPARRIELFAAVFGLAPILLLSVPLLAAVLHRGRPHDKMTDNIIPVQVISCHVVHLPQLPTLDDGFTYSFTNPGVYWYLNFAQCYDFDHFSLLPGSAIG